jgi:type III pantothenate kinase
MLLAIDAGNTNIVFAVCEGETIRAQWRAITKTIRTADEYGVWLADLLALQDMRLSDLNSAIISCVVPDALFDLRNLCRRYLKCEPLVVGTPEVPLGIKIDYDRPDSVGADRLADAVAGHTLYGGPLIVVDFGTATTFNVVSETGDYEGGVIAPGVNLSAEALHHATALLPRVAFHRTATVIGKDTVTAMQSGMYWGYVSFIEGLVSRIKAEYGKPMTVVATGGLASIFQRQVSGIDHVDPDLTVKGLMLIHARNRERAKQLPPSE